MYSEGVVVVCSALWHTTLFRLFSAPSATFPSRSIQRQRANYMVSACHAAVTSSYAFVEILTNEKLAHVEETLFATQSSVSFRYMCCFLIGYMLYDSYICTFLPETESKVYVLHHAIAIFGASVGACGHFEFLIVLFFLGELPVVLVDLSLLAQFSHHHALHAGLKRVAVVLWVACRISLIPYVPLKIISALHHSYPPNCMLFGSLVVVFVVLSGMNVYWLKEVIRDSYTTHSEKDTPQALD